MLELASPLVVTGAAGTVGSALVERLLARPEAPDLRLVDLPGTGLDRWRPRATVVEADLQDDVAVADALAGAGAVVHLAGQPSPAAAWPDLVAGNLTLTAAVLDAAASHGVRHVVLASSVHAAGDVGPPGWPVDPQARPRPCCRYGVTKAAVELLGRDHAHAHPPASVVALRFGLVAERPRWRDEALGWSPLDALAAWVLAAAGAPAGFRCVHAVATVEGRARYVTAPTTELLGHERPVRPADLEGLPRDRPELAAACRLWRHDGPDAT